MISKVLGTCLFSLQLLPLLLLLRLGGLSAAPSGPESDTCSTLVQNRFFGFFFSSFAFPNAPCSWTLQNPDPRRYTIFIKVTKPSEDCVPRQHRTFQYDSFLETTRTYLGMESFDEIMKLCDASTHMAFLEAGKQFLQIRKGPARGGSGPEEGNGEFKVEYLVVGKRNPSMAACQMLCQWLEDCLTYSTSNRPCGIMQIPCQCGHTPLHDKEGNGCYRDGIYLENCYPTVKGTPSDTDTSEKDKITLISYSQYSSKAKVLSTLKYTGLEDTKLGKDRYSFRSQSLRSADSRKREDVEKSRAGQQSPQTATCGEGWQSRTRFCVSASYSTQCSGPLREQRPCNNTAVCPAALIAVHGAWDEWSPWSLCSSTCGRGYRDRTRTCKPPQFGGDECVGPEKQTKFCNIAVCPVDGVWNEWSSWSSCSVSCSNGTMQRTRECNGPSYGGSECQGTIFRRCSLDEEGIAYWEIPSYMKCISNDYRSLQTLTRDHLSKAQRGLVGDGVSEVMNKLRVTSSEGTSYSGDLLAIIDILKNMTEIFRRSYYSPSSADMRNFVQSVSNLLMEENRDRWEEAQLLGPNVKELFRLVEDFVDVISLRMKDFQDNYEVTDNLVLSLHKRPVAGNADISFPKKGWMGMEDWARNSEDKVTISKSIVSSGNPAEDEASAFVTGIVLYRNLGSILSLQRNNTVLNSKVISVTIKPTPISLSAPVEIEFSHLYNGTTNQTCISWDESDSSSPLGSWSARACRAVPVHAFRTKCVCERLSAFAILARLSPDAVFGLNSVCSASVYSATFKATVKKSVLPFRDENMDPSKSQLPSVTLIVGCGVSSLTLLLLIIIYVSVWRYIRSERSVILINFCLSIISSNALILIGQTQTRNKVVCTLVAAFLHFFFLSSFCWVLTEAWQSYMAVTGRLRNRIIRKRFLCLGWGLPALVVAISVGFTKAKGYGTVNYKSVLSCACPFTSMFSLLQVNMVIGILVFNKLVSKDGITDMKLKERAGASLWSSCVVLPLLALTWMSAVLAITDRRSALFQILFAIFDSLEGFVIVMVHCILRREVQEAVKCRVVDRQEDGNGDSGGSFQNGHAQLMTDFEKDVDIACRSGPGKRSSLQGEEKLAPQQLTVQKGSNFNTMPASMAKVHLQNVAEYGSHTLTLRRDKGATAGISTELPGAKAIYVCDGELFKQLEGDNVGSEGGGVTQGYNNNTITATTLRTTKPTKEDSKYNISIEHVPQTRLIHLSNTASTEPVPGYGLKSFPAERVNVSCSEKDSPLQNLSSEAHRTNSALEPVDSGNSGVMSKSETISTLSMSSLERRKSRYAELDFEKIMHTRKRHQDMFQDLNRKLQHAEKDRESPPVDSKPGKRWSVSSGGSDKTNLSDKQQTPSKRAWEGIRKTHSPPSWVRKELEPLQASPLELQAVEWEKTSATIPLVGQEIMDLQTEV
ncbi:hypothetical protein QTP70_011499 [Hemibagrus guttatus]|uniref:Adhesion G protein-coupled receptor B1 n=1 Tax=Hemibagrus guttatus TaxID=175788 RepID=A0AAE0REX3_9TELE|nr:hypothetical protein QTP70_011499 [Hemibagrus guttatus]